MRRFRPDTRMVDSYCWGELVESAEVCMVESQYGAWTPWQNAHDAIAMYQKRIARLEARLARTEDELFLLKATI